MGRYEKARAIAEGIANRWDKFDDAVGIEWLARKIIELWDEPLPRAVQPHGCVCPPGAEAGCRGLCCPRRVPANMITGAQYPHPTTAVKGMIL